MHGWPAFARTRWTIPRVLLAASWWLIAAPVLVSAAEPSPAPTPLVFHTPQYLVFMESHQTSYGPVRDDAYWLYIDTPDADGALVVPGGDGSVWHYRGRLIAGPFAGAADACPAMLAVGVTALEAWRVAAGETAQVVDCTGYLDSPVVSPSAGTSTSTSSSAGPSVPPLGDAVGERDSMGIILAVLGSMLAGSGIAISRGGRSRQRPVAEREPPADPCAEQVADELRASVRGRQLNDLLASCRRYEALLQEQIDILANLVLPGSVLLDLGFAAGSLSGSVGPKLIATTTFRQALGEAVLKDVLKELAKQGLGSAGGLDAEKLRGEANKSALKESILTAVERGIASPASVDALLAAGPTSVFRNAGEYTTFMRQARELAESVAEPIKSGLGAVIDLYDGVSNGLELKARLDGLRAARDQLADRRVELELDLESAIEAQRFAAERLAHCRAVNDPSRRP